MSILQFSYSILASFLISLYIFLPIPCTIILGIAFKTKELINTFLHSSLLLFFCIVFYLCFMENIMDP